VEKIHIPGRRKLKNRRATALLFFPTKQTAYSPLRKGRHGGISGLSVIFVAAIVRFENDCIAIVLETDNRFPLLLILYQNYHVELPRVPQIEAKMNQVYIYIPLPLSLQFGPVLGRTPYALGRLAQNNLPFVFGVHLNLTLDYVFDAGHCAFGNAFIVPAPSANIKS